MLSNIQKNDPVLSQRKNSANISSVLHHLSITYLNFKFILKLSEP